MAMASSDERREVARKLRDCIFYAKGHDLDGDCDMWSDKCVETRCTLYNDIAACIEEGGNVNLSSEEVFTRLADLIDPTCEVMEVPDNDEFMVRVVSGFVCKRCGHEAIVERNCDGSAEPPRFCPHCGARVTSGGDIR